MRILSDLTELAIQDSRVMAVYAETTLLLAQARPERHALVIRSALQRLQARRVMTDYQFEIFATLEEAGAWLEWPIDELRRVRGPVAPPSLALADR